MSCPPVALYFAELHAGCGETPVWKRRFGADACLRTMEGADECPWNENKACPLPLLMSHPQFLI